MPTLVYSDTDGIDRSFSLGPDPVLVGRAAECTIRSDDPRVSRMHAKFFIDQGTLWVEDLGSANGIFVGPQKVQRAQVPVGEIILVGSLMLRLLPASGTLPPPMGLHGTLAQWLEMERKARAAIEEERNAFAKRVGELHEEIRPLKDVRAAHDGEAVGLRSELDELRKTSAKELEATRLELAKAREAKMIAETQAGMTVAEKLAEADMTISRLEHQLEQARAARGTPPDPTLGDQVLVLTGRADKAEKELAAAQIRAQGAERNLTAATTQAARAEGRAAELVQKIADGETVRAKLDGEIAELREKLSALDTRLGAGDAPLQASEARAAKLVGEIAEVKSQLEASRERVAEAERETQSAMDAVVSASSDVASHAERLLQAQARIHELEARIAGVSGAEEKIEVARKERETARERAAASDVRIVETTARADEAEKRATAADTMAKAMAKDVAEALRRAVDADSRARGVMRELDGAQRRAEAAEGRDAKLQAAVAEAQARATAAADKLAELEPQLVAKHEQAQRELADKLEQAQRELSAERSSAMSLVDRRAQLERDLEAARTKITEYEVTIDQLEERIEDLESGLAVEQTAARSSLGDARGQIDKLEGRLEELEQELTTAKEGRAEADGERTLERQRVTTAEGRIGELETRAREAEARAAREADRARESEGRAKEIETRSKEIEARGKDIEQRAKEVAERIVDAERRAREAQAQLADAQRRMKQLEDDEGIPTRDGTDVHGELAAAQARIAELQREVDAADNVRQFAASTEREIAQLQRELRDMKAKLGQVTLERDGLESQLRDVREDSETRMLGTPPTGARVAVDPEATAMADMSRYSALVNQLADAEAKLAMQDRAREDAPTNTGHTLPIEFAEHLSMLEEAIDSLRANMRAASDETAMMDQTDSVIAVASAVSQAAEHVERARDAVRVLTTIVKR